MQVKVFEAPDMATGLKMVKKSLGPDALILSTKTIRKGKVGLLTKPIMEITAAIDTPGPSTLSSGRPAAKRSESGLTYESVWKAKPEKAVPGTYGPKATAEPDPRAAAGPATHLTLHTPAPSSRVRPAAEDMARQAAALQESGTAQGSEIRAGFPGAATDNDSSRLKEEIRELRELVTGLNKKISVIDQVPAAVPRPQPEHRGGAGLSTPVLPFPHPLISMLTGKGVHPETAADIVHRLEQKLDTNNQAGGKYDEETVKNHLSSLFAVRDPLPGKNSGQKRLALIGPTGVGKTTTIAKLAAGYMNRYHGKIGLITIDTYRIAAVEQLKVYGEIMQLPVEVVIKPHELPIALEKLADRDLILIDTAGRSPRNRNEIQEMTTFLRPDLDIENHLVLSATTRDQELLRTIERFSCLPLASFLYTKLDECEELGVIANIRHVNDTPLSFLTNGQRVPEDIMRAEPHTVAELIMDANFAHRGTGREQ